MKAFLMSARGAAVGLAAALVVAAVWINVRSGASTAGTPEAQNWSLETHEGSRAVLEQLAPANSPDSMRVTISSLPEGAATWYVKLFQRSYAIDAGTRYRASFRARAEAARPVACAVGNNHEPWEGLGDYHEYTVTTEWSTYECPFTASADDSNARLFFDLGQSEGWVELTGVVLQDETNDRALQPN